MRLVVAVKALKNLHTLGLLTPIRTCEYKLSDAGQARLDSSATTLGMEARDG